jgi:hypothetical protein
MEQSTAYEILLERAMDMNELCLRIRDDIDKLGLVVARETLNIDMQLKTRAITREQHDHLIGVFTEGIEELYTP